MAMIVFLIILFAVNVVLNIVILYNEKEEKKFQEERIQALEDLRKAYMELTKELEEQNSLLRIQIKLLEMGVR